MKVPMSSFGDWIDVLQKTMRPSLSDQELADKVGCTRQHIWKIKHAQTTLTANMVRSIADALEVEQHQAMRFAFFEQEQIATPEELTQIVYSVHPAQRAALVQAVRAMAQALNSSQSVSA